MAVTTEELYKNAFYYLNSMKRHRALYNIERASDNSNKDQLQYHELKMYQFTDNLELALRALQSDMRHGGNQNEEKRPV